ncbi:MAG TPA: hypothetical protein VKQ52_10240 [Puia sp.]|nr:hypothetical protein [Puia sp.]
MAKKDKNTIDLPEVKDIPGQENIKPPRLGELADTTASSADEEGDDVLEQDDDLAGPGSNVSRDERRALANVDNREVDTEDEVLNEAALDSTDDDGDPLNEGSFGSDVSSDDLDIPGADEDDSDEELGEEDEENNDYSISDNNDDTDINYDA